ncbi:aromatic amino acid lyase [Candidatus Kuenenbacteria bacterium]|nr:aromatic amino acid lyase [Candidatus Kuenenbacteria bacterium]
MVTRWKDEIFLDGHNLTVEDVILVARGSKGEYPTVRLHPSKRDKLSLIRKEIEKLLLTDVMYGVNTGAGSNRDRIVPLNKLLGYQRGYTLSHCCGSGLHLKKDVVRAMMLLRVNSFMVGYSGVTVELCDKILELLNNDIVPVIPEHGSLGASGDLSPLAHLAAVLIGYTETRVMVNGEIRPTRDVLKERNICFLKLQPKEAMAVTNGATMMLAYSCLAVHDAVELLRIANIAAALNMEAIRGEMDALDMRIHLARNQVGQREVAEDMNALLKNSKRVTREAQNVCFVHEDKKDCIESCTQRRVQDAYSTRCVPQAHGAVFDAIWYLREKVENEICAATDNPLIFRNEDGTYSALSGGNFHGDPLAIPLDTLAIALTKLAVISDRRFFRVINSQYSHGLPQNLSVTEDHSSGFMIPQYSAGSDALRCGMLSMPASVFNVVTSGMQEDYVSNGANAAWKCRLIIEFVRDALAKELLAQCQAIDLGKERLKPMGLDLLGEGTAPAHRFIRDRIGMMKQDGYFTADFEEIRKTLENGSMLRAVEDKE